MAKKNKDGLTPRQERFCQEYVIDHVATQAAIRSRYSRRTAEQIGYQLLQIPSVQKRIQGLDDAIARRAHMSADQALEKLAEIINADVAELCNEDGSIRSLREMPVKFRKLLNGIEWGIDGRPKVRLPDRNTALTNLLKHHKLITERHEVYDKTLEQILGESWAADDEANHKRPGKTDQ